VKKKFLAAAAGALLATVAVYALVPPPQHVSAAGFADQATFGGTSTGSVSGSTTSYAITIPNLSTNPTGVVLRFIPNVTNVGPTQINVSGIGLVNVLRHSSIGNVAFSGGEFMAGELTCITFDGTAYELTCNVDMTRIGDAVQFRGGTTPRGTLIEDGTCVSQTTFAALFSVIGNTYTPAGGGSCATGLFAVPDSRGTGFVALDGQGANGLAGRVTAASCATPNAVGICGHETATLTVPQLPVFTPSVSFDFTINSNGQSGGAESLVNNITAIGGGTTVDATVASIGGGLAHPILNPASFGRRAIKY
jgi:hypothetical protein